MSDFNRRYNYTRIVSGHKTNFIFFSILDLEINPISSSIKIAFVNYQLFT